MTADDAIVTYTCGKEHRYDTDPHEWKPTMTDCTCPPGFVNHATCPTHGDVAQYERVKAATALDADTLRDLVERGPVLPISADLAPTFTTIFDARGLTVAQHVPRSWARLIVALVNAAPALLDDAEAAQQKDAQIAALLDDRDYWKNEMAADRERIATAIEDGCEHGRKASGGPCGYCLAAARIARAGGTDEQSCCPDHA